MKRYILTLLCLPICSAYALDLEKQIQTTIAKTIANVDNHPVWPGFKLGTMPILNVTIEDIEKPIYAHLYSYNNFQPKNPDWQRIIINHNPAYYLDHDAYQLVDFEGGGSYAWGHLEIDGQEVFTCTTPINRATEQGINHDILDMVHLRFEDFYTHDNDNTYFYLSFDNDSYNNPQLVKLSYLENNILKTYLQDETPNKDEILKDALAIGEYRLYVLLQVARQSDLSLEYHYGLKLKEQIPAYVGAKSLGMSDKDAAQLLPKACDATAPSLYDISLCENLQREILPGIAYGKALDRARGKTWKLDILNRRIFMENLVEEAYAITGDDMVKRVERILTNSEYNYAQISQSIDKILKPYLDELNTQENNYKLQPGIEMEIYNLQKDTETSFKPKKGIGSENKSYVISNARSLITNVYGEFNHGDRDNHIVVDFFHTPYVYFNDVTRGENRIPWINKYKIPVDSAITIDGRTMTVGDFINARKQVAFDNLKLESGSITVYVKGMKGILDATNGVLKLKTTDISSSPDAKKRLAAARKRMHDNLLFDPLL